jgi:hypothetical protein
VKFLVTLLNLFVQGLIFDLKLLEINQVEAISQLLLLLIDLVKVVVTVAQGNILKTVLMHFLVLDTFVDLPLLDH